jgi:hypothetical protein
MPAVSLGGAFKARSHEKVSTLTSAIGFTSTKYEYNPSTETPSTRVLQAEEVTITVETADIRWTCDGTTPTVTSGTALGHIASAGDVITLTGYDNIKNFKAINAVGASGATLRATFWFQQ